MMFGDSRGVNDAASMNEHRTFGLSQEPTMTILATTVRFMVIALAAVTVVSAQTQGGWNHYFDSSRVNDCIGNCGAGCSSDWNPCGGPTQYWDFELVSTPVLVSDWWEEYCEWNGGDGAKYFYHWGKYIADFRYTY